MDHAAKQQWCKQLTLYATSPATLLFWAHNYNNNNNSSGFKSRMLERGREGQWGQQQGKDPI